MEWLLEHLTSLSASSIYLTLGGILLLCGLGLPMPEDITLISAGYLAYLGLVDVHRVFALCFLTVLAGDAMAFAVGWFFGHRLLRSAFARRHFTARKQRRVRAYFRKFGSRVIFIARFLPGLRFSMFISAGTLRVRPSVFLIYDGLAAALSVPALVYLAWYFGQHIDHVVRWVRRSERGILVLVALAALLIGVKLLRRRRQAAAERAERAALARAELTPPGDPPASSPQAPGA